MPPADDTLSGAPTVYGSRGTTGFPDPVTPTLFAGRVRTSQRRPGAAISAAVLIAVLTGGCIRREITRVDVTPDAMDASPELRAATNLPDRFTIVTPGAASGDCPLQLRDGGLQATLRLQRSVLRQVADSTGTVYRATGDYAVEPPGVYGEEPGEGVRVDCGGLRPIGVVRL